MYKKPLLKTYSAELLLEEMGAVQSQYSYTFHTTSGNSSVNVDGFIRHAPGTGNYFVYENDSAGIMIGDVGGPPPFTPYQRGFVGFDISSLVGRTVVSATLNLYQVGTEGAPYTLGQLTIDHVNFQSSLDATDFGGGSIADNIGTISTDANPGWKTCNVTTQVQNDLSAGRTSSQYRLVLGTSNNNSVTDSCFFEDYEKNRGTVFSPELVVTYN